MANLLSSQILIQEEEPRIRSAVSIPTALPAFLGIAERGPIAEPQFITSFDQYVKIFGGFTANSDLALAMQAFYQNGGSGAWVSRTVHYTDITDRDSSIAVVATITLVDRAGAPLSTLKIDGKTPGAYGNDIKVIIEAPTNGDADEFNLKVEEDGIVKEIFPNLSMTDTDTNYVEDVINDVDTGSNVIAATDLDSATASPNDLPALGTFSLASGNDGLTGLADTDFVGDPTEKTGLRAFDDVQDLTILAVPGRSTSAVHNAMITYAEVTRAASMFAVLDPPAGNSASQIKTYVQTTASLQELSEFGAIYWPRVKILNPSTVVFGTAAQITVPPSGHIVGTYARVDSSFVAGVYRAPAGIEAGRLFNVLGFETNEVLEKGARDLVYPVRVNPLTSFPGAPRFIDGVRTLKGTGNFPTVPERRGVIFIEQTVKRTLEGFRFASNDEFTREAVELTIVSFLLTQVKNRAFRSQDPSKAFFVDADVSGESINPPSEQFAGRLNVRIGLATNKPAEFIVLTFSQDVRALEEEIQTANTGR